MSESIYLCPKCDKSIRCDTWAEYKCEILEKRIYGYKQLTDPAQCKFYRKRGKDFKEPKCQCEDCLKSERLAEELEV